MTELRPWQKRQADLLERRERNKQWREQSAQRSAQDARAEYVKGADAALLVNAKDMRNALIDVVSTFKPKTELERAVLQRCRAALGRAHINKPKKGK